MMGYHIPMSPSLCLLGNTSVTNLNKSSNKLLLTALTIAKKTILINWKNRNDTNITHWKNLLIEHISLEYSPIPTQNSAVEPLSVSAPLLNYLQS